MSIDRDTLDGVVLDVVRGMPEGEWSSADLVQRMVSRRLGFGVYNTDAPTIMKVARSLARLYDIGKLNRDGRGGAWVYQSNVTPCRICGLPEERHGLCPGHREEWIQWASRRPTVQNDRGFDEWIESRRRDIYGEDA